MAKKSTTPPKQVNRPVISDPGLKTIFIDSIEIGFREDNLCFLRMVTELPEGKVEQGKFFIPRHLLENVIKGAAEILESNPIKQ